MNAQVRFRRKGDQDSQKHSPFRVAGGHRFLAGYQFSEEDFFAARKRRALERILLDSA
ncbi:hypothetical protein [[Kitasatospora] papulosa]|uniref:hypothetical protein n=1 Tax=[Kitasatospora] papulosa TaxID=1464011 RepID=UPI00369E69BA